MIEMNPEPAPIENIEPITQDFCTSEESEERILICKTCDNFEILEIVTVCNKCGCNINMLISHKSKRCPIGKW